VRHFAEELRRRILEPEAELQQQQQQGQPQQQQQGQDHAQGQNAGQPPTATERAQLGGVPPGSHPVSIFDVAATGAHTPAACLPFSDISGGAGTEAGEGAGAGVQGSGGVLEGIEFTEWGARKW